MAGKAGKGSAAGSARGGGDGSDAKGGSTPAGSGSEASGGGGGGAAGAASTAAASTATPSIARSAASTGGGGGGGSTRGFGFAVFFAAGRGLRGGGATRAFGGAGFRAAGFSGFAGAGFAATTLRFGGACAGGAAGAGGGRTRGRGTARCAATCRFGFAFKRCVAAAREARIFAAFASLRSAAAARAWAAAAKGSVVATEDMSLCVKAVDGQPLYRRRAALRQSVCVRNGRAALLCCRVLNSRVALQTRFDSFSSMLSLDDTALACGTTDKSP